MATGSPARTLLEMYDGNDRLVLDHGASGAPVVDCSGQVVAVVPTKGGVCIEELQKLCGGYTTDPPYALVILKRFGADNAAPAKSNGPTGVYQRASAGCMGKRGIQVITFLPFPTSLSGATPLATSSHP
jgi:hypothetical protein